MQTGTFNLKVVSKEGIVFEGKVVSISSYNENGKFDVLSSHANFISLIQKKVEIIDTEGKSTSIDLHNALLKVVQNEVRIYVGLEGVMNFPDSGGPADAL